MAAILEESALFGPITLLAGDVTLRTFRDELSRHDVLHYAGHAEAGDVSGGGRLRLRDGFCTTGLLEQLRRPRGFPRPRVPECLRQFG